MLGRRDETVAKLLMTRRLGGEAEPYRTGGPGALMAAAERCWRRGWRARCSAAAAGSVAAVAGAALMAASALTRFGIFEAGQASARDPKYTVGPQRERLQARHDRT